MSTAPDTIEALPVRLADLQIEIREVNEANGWHEEERTFGEDLALLHSEISEAFEAYRDHGFADATARVSATGCIPKPEGVGSELADVLIRLLDSCDRLDISPYWIDQTLADIEPSDLRPGSFGDRICDLHQIVSVGNLPGLMHLLIAVAREVGVDLQAEAQRKVAFNRTRGYRHGGKRI